MTPPPFPPELERFVDSHIDSLEQLEILLLLRNRREVPWTPMAVASELRLHPAMAWGWLASLHAGALLTREPGEGSDQFRYSPKEEDARLIDALADARSERPGALSALIARHSVDELQAFSEAFYIRKRY